MTQTGGLLYPRHPLLIFAFDVFLHVSTLIDIHNNFNRKSNHFLMNTWNRFNWNYITKMYYIFVKRIRPQSQRSNIVFLCRYENGTFFKLSKRFYTYTHSHTLTHTHTYTYIHIHIHIYIHSHFLLWLDFFSFVRWKNGERDREKSVGGGIFWDIEFWIVHKFRPSLSVCLNVSFSIVSQSHVICERNKKTNSFPYWKICFTIHV